MKMTARGSLLVSWANLQHSGTSSNPGESISRTSPLIVTNGILKSRFKVCCLAAHTPVTEYLEPGNLWAAFARTLDITWWRSLQREGVDQGWTNLSLNTYALSHLNDNFTIWRFHKKIYLFIKKCSKCSEATIWWRGTTYQQTAHCMTSMTSFNSFAQRGQAHHTINFY